MTGSNVKGSLWNPLWIRTAASEQDELMLVSKKKKKKPHIRYSIASFYIQKIIMLDILPHFPLHLSTVCVWVCVCMRFVVSQPLFLPPIVISDFSLWSSFTTLLLPFLSFAAVLLKEKRRRCRRRRKNPPVSHSPLACSITSYPNNERGKTQFVFWSTSVLRRRSGGRKRRR